MTIMFARSIKNARRGPAIAWYRPPQKSVKLRKRDIERRFEKAAQGDAPKVGDFRILSSRPDLYDLIDSNNKRF
jgi:hypothetical protein